jgi:hypothetical protein
MGKDVCKDSRLDVGGVEGLERVGSGSVGARSLGFVEKSEVHWMVWFGFEFFMGLELTGGGYEKVNGYF